MTEMPEPTRAERRANELAATLAEINALLEASDASFAVQQTMTIGPDGTPRYSYLVQLVSR